MAKEKFLIVATRMPDNCFARFSESKNRAALDAGTADPDDAYSWIEASYNIELRRYREATHICSFTPSAYYVWLQNYFVGQPNALWQIDGDPLGLENESGGEGHGYGTYYDEYPAEMICDSFTLDTVKLLGLRKPRASKSLSRRNASERQSRLEDEYHAAIWQAAEEGAGEIRCNGGFWCEGLDVFRFRQREKAASSPRLCSRGLCLSHNRTIANTPNQKQESNHEGQNQAQANRPNARDEAFRAKAESPQARAAGQARQRSGARPVHGDPRYGHYPPQ